MKIKRIGTLRSQAHQLSGLLMRWHRWHMVAQLSCDIHVISEGVRILPKGCVPMNVLAPIQYATKGNLDAWLGMVRVDQGGLRNLAKWG